MSEARPGGERAGNHRPAVPPGAAELVQGIHWLVRLRWLALLGVVVVVEGLGHLASGPLALTRLRVTTAVLAIHTVLLTVVLVRNRWSSAVPDGSPLERVTTWLILLPVHLLGVALAAIALLSGRRPIPDRPSLLRAFLVPHALKGLDGEREAYAAALLASAQIAFDLSALAALLHFSGGLENPFVFFLVFHVIVSSILLSRRATYLTTTVGFGLAVLMGLLEMRGVLAHHAVPLLDEHGEYASGAFVSAQLFVLGMTLYLAAYLASAIVAHLRQYERESVLLAAELSDKADELHRAWTRVSQAEQAKSLYMRRVAHELKSPLATVQSVLQVVLGGHAGEISDRTRDLVERAERRTGELAQTTQDILTLTHAREGGVAGQRLPVDLAEVVSEVVADFAAAAQAAGISLTLEGTGEGWPPLSGKVLGEATALRQLVRNLVGNAVRYSRGGDAVRVRLDEPEAGRARLEVEDTGIGIPEADLPSVFDEFFRSTNAKKHVAGGTGLGLAIVKAVAEQHGGEVAVRSTLGRGTCFTVRLPLERKEAADAADPARGRG